jgi:hypothetical protein
VYGTQKAQTIKEERKRKIRGKEHTGRAEST